MDIVLSWGIMRIGNEVYEKDLIILPNDEIKEDWRRKSGHNLVPEDLPRDLGKSVLVIGTGVEGRMTVPKETISELESQGYEVKVLKSFDALEEYKNLRIEKKRVWLAIHLTC